MKISYELIIIIILLTLFSLGVGYESGQIEGKEKGKTIIIKVPISNCKEGHMK